MADELTIQAHWNGQWHDTGTVMFRDGSLGLQGPIQFYYSPLYVNNADTYRPGLSFIDERAIGVNVPGDFAGHYDESQIAPVLRDIIPQGAGRRALLRLWGSSNPDQAKAEVDYKLLSEGCVAPVGNLRVKEAAQRFEDRVQGLTPTAFTRADVAERNEAMLDYAHGLGIAIGGATGAGGDASKLLLVEGRDGGYYLEGTLPEQDIRQHWLVKFPRGRMLQEDEDVLRGEAVFYQALSALGLNTIHRAELHEGRTPSLWLPRFDRTCESGQVQRFGLESAYSLLQMVGDGARMEHPDVIRAMQQVCHTDPEEFLVEYLVRDAVNTAIGNSDNHGRNMALLKRDGVIQLAPAFDLAPMVMDREGIARSTVWPNAMKTKAGGPDYQIVLDALANNPESVANRLRQRFEVLARLPLETRDANLPVSVKRHPRVRLNHFEVLLEQLSGQAGG